MELISWNAVVTAHQFNPSIFTQLWLVRQAIVSEQEFEEQVSVDGVSQFQTQQFTLVVVPQMLQFVPRPGLGRAVEANLVETKVGALVRALPHTPYRAVGLNFMWYIPLAPEMIAEATHRLFYRNTIPFSMFDSDDARFGAYMSRGFEGSRLKLDIRPIHRTTDGIDTEDRLALMFNFHKDAVDNPVASIEETIRLWDRAKEESRRIVSEIERELGIE